MNAAFEDLYWGHAISCPLLEQERAWLVDRGNTISRLIDQSLTSSPCASSTSSLYTSGPLPTATPFRSKETNTAVSYPSFFSLIP